MPGRNYNAANRADYSYGFNGKLNDNDVKGVEGGQQDYGMRIYNPRVGKFLSVDPLTKNYPSWSPYPFAMNRVIDGIDIDGLEWMDFNHSLISIAGLKYDTKLNKITSFQTFYRMDENINPPALLDAIKAIPNKCNNCIGYEQSRVATFTLNKLNPLVKADTDASATDMETPTLAKPQDHQLPIIPKNKREEREQRKTKNYFTPGITAGNAKVSGILSAIDLGGQLLANVADENVRNYIQNAQVESKGVAIAAINLIQSELDKGTNSLIPAKYRNEESLNQLANFLLYGQPITTYETDDKGNLKINNELTDIGNKLFLPIREMREKQRQQSIQNQMQRNRADKTRVVKKR